MLQLKCLRRDGTTHIRMSPLEFMQRLAALVLRPRLHLIRFHGVLAPNAGLRAAIVPGRTQKPSVAARSGSSRRRRAGGDRRDPHAPALPGAADGAFPGGLIPEAKTVLRRG